MQGVYELRSRAFVLIAHACMFVHMCATPGHNLAMLMTTLPNTSTLLPRDKTKKLEKRRKPDIENFVNCFFMEYHAFGRNLSLELVVGCALGITLRKSHFIPVVYRVNVTSVRLRWETAVTVLSCNVNVSYSSFSM